MKITHMGPESVAPDSCDSVWDTGSGCGYAAFWTTHVVIKSVGLGAALSGLES